MQATCDHHKQEIQRVCLTKGCQRNPLMCWECLVDDQDHSQSHRENIIQSSDLIETISLRLEREWAKRKEDRLSSSSQYLHFVQNNNKYVEEFTRHIESQKKDVSSFFNDLSTQFYQMCCQSITQCKQKLDSQLKVYTDSVKTLKKTIQERYGFIPMTNKSEIEKKIREIGSENTLTLGQYIIELKRMLESPEDLTNNFTFNENFKNVKSMKENPTKIDKKQSLLLTRNFSSDVKLNLEDLEKNVLNLIDFRSFQIQQPPHQIQHTNESNASLLSGQNNYSVNSSQRQAPMSAKQGDNSENLQPMNMLMMNHDQNQPRGSHHYRNGSNSHLVNGTELISHQELHHIPQFNDNLMNCIPISNTQINVGQLFNDTTSVPSSITSNSSRILRTQDFNLPPQQPFVNYNMQYNNNQIGGGVGVRDGSRDISKSKMGMNPPPMHNNSHVIKNENMSVSTVTTETSQFIAAQNQDLLLKRSNVRSSRLNVPESLTKINLSQKITHIHNRPINCILQINDQLFASGSKDKKVQIWQAKTHEIIHELEGHEDAVCALCTVYSSGKLYLVSGGGNLDSSVYVWDIEQGTVVHKFIGHQSAITCLLPLGEEQTVASGSYDNHVILWNVRTGEALCALRKHEAMISSMALVCDGKKLVVGSWDKTISIWKLNFNEAGGSSETPTGKQVRGTVASCEFEYEIKEDFAVLTVAGLASDTNSILYAGTNKFVNLFSFESMAITRRFTASPFGVSQIVVFENMQNKSDFFIVGVCGGEATLRVWHSSAQNEIAFKKDPDNIELNNYNTTPKVQCVGVQTDNMKLKGLQFAIANNTEGANSIGIWDLNFNA